MSHTTKLLVALALAAGFAATSHAAGTTDALLSAPTASNQIDKVGRECGIKVSGLFLSGGGNLVDFRYQVLDPVKAAALTKPESKPVLLDQSTGAKLQVPTTPKTGPLRQTTKQPVAGKIYFMLFANTRHHTKSGDKVTITVGDIRLENLIVE